MKTIVITGSTRGIGFGLADEFLRRACAVSVSGRTQISVAKAVEKLKSRHEADCILGQPCDVRDFEQVQDLWDMAKAHFGRIDAWINNAGIAHHQQDFWTHPPQDVAAVLETNLRGTMYGSKVALTGMMEQGFGGLYNMEGLGSDGRRVQRLTLYGSTKRGMHYLTEALVEETADTPILVGALSPGMVLTDMLTQQYREHPDGWEEAKRIFNILADRVDTVAPWLVEQILSNTETGARIK